MVCLIKVAIEGLMAIDREIRASTSRKALIRNSLKTRETRIRIVSIVAGWIEASLAEIEEVSGEFIRRK